MPKVIQSEDACVADLRSVKDIHLFLSSMSEYLTKMVNMALETYDPDSSFQPLEIRWMNILDEKTNPSGYKGFWDVYYDKNKTSSSTLQSPQIVKFTEPK